MNKFKVSRRSSQHDSGIFIFSHSFNAYAIATNQAQLSSRFTRWCHPRMLRLLLLYLCPADKPALTQLKKNELNDDYHCRLPFVKRAPWGKRGVAFMPLCAISEMRLRKIEKEIISFFQRYFTLKVAQFPLMDVLEPTEVSFNLK